MSIFREENNHHINALPDLKQLMDVVHNIPDGDHVIGNSRVSWNLLTFQEDLRISLKELETFHDKYPKLFKPAFMLQHNMMLCFMGESWWEIKVRTYSERLYYDTNFIDRTICFTILHRFLLLLTHACCLLALDVLILCIIDLIWVLYCD